MAYSVLSLRDVIKEIGESKYQQFVASFFCPFDEDIEYFLKEKAVLFENSDISRTYLVYASYKSEQVLVGYFAIANKVLPINNGISNSLRKKLIGPTKERKASISAYLIGQLSKNFDNNFKTTNLISGEELLRLALKKIDEANRVVGGRVILVECADNPRLREFYEKYGFKFYDKNGDGLLRYLRRIKNIEVP